MKRVTTRVISNQRVMPDAFLVWLEAPEIAQLARPGQFVLIQTGKGHFLPRPISIHQKTDSQIALLIRIAGKGTEWLSLRKAGEPLKVIGTLGNGFSIKPTSKKLLLVAGGMGIAPLMFLAQEAIKRNCSVILLKGATTKAELYPDNLIPKGIEIASATDDGTIGKIGVVTTLLQDYSNILLSGYIGWANQVFACGPLGMYKDLARRRNELVKDKPCQISLEMRMACGHGVCYGCTIETKKGLKQVCKDGPVFELDEVKDTLANDASCTRWLTV